MEFCMSVVNRFPTPPFFTKIDGIFYPVGLFAPKSVSKRIYGSRRFQKTGLQPRMAPLWYFFRTSKLGQDFPKIRKSSPRGGKIDFPTPPFFHKNRWHFLPSGSFCTKLVSKLIYGSRRFQKTGLQPRMAPLWYFFRTSKLGQLLRHFFHF